MKILLRNLIDFNFTHDELLEYWCCANDWNCAGAGLMIDITHNFYSSVIYDSNAHFSTHLLIFNYFSDYAIALIMMILVSILCYLMS